MVIEGYGESERDDEEDCENGLIDVGGEQEAEEIDEENDEFCGHDVDEDGTDEEAVFAFEEGATGGAMMFDVERLFND
jgi:hypothetical protein